MTAGSVFGQLFPPPPYYNSFATMPGAGDHEMALFNIPDGSGSSFFNAQIRDDGSIIDAHIELFVRDEVYLRYAREFLPENQLDAVDVNKYLAS